MASTLQLRGADTATVNAITAASREVLVDTTTNRLRVGDGSTAGGHVVALLADVSAHPGITNLSGSGTASVYTVASDTGTNATIPAATNAAAGVATAAQITELEALRTNVGNSATSTNLGTFTGVTIQDNRTVKQALQDIETEVEDRLPDFVRWRSGTGAGYYFDGNDDRIITTNFPFGTEDFTILLEFSHRDIPSAYENMVRTGTGNNRFSIGADAGKYVCSFVDNAGAATIVDLPVTQKLGKQVGVFVFDRDSNVTLYIDGEQVAAGSISSASSVNLSLNTGAYYLGNSTFSFDGEFYRWQVLNRAVTATEAANLSLGQRVGFADRGATGASITSGTLTVGKRYRISNFQSGDSFTNVGAASNTTGVEFVATGTTPTTWTNSSSLTQLGEVLSLLPSGAAPTVWADQSGNGYNGTVTGATLINPMPLHADAFVSLTNLPTSSAGLATGRVWNDSGTLKVV